MTTVHTLASGSSGNALLVSCGATHLLVDAGISCRRITTSLAALGLGLDDLDALLITHSHYDHVGGMDDLRPYCREIPFPVYAQPNVVADIKARIPYCFREHLYPGVPTFDMHPLAGEPFEVKGVRVEPLPVMHYKLPIFGYRIGNLAYITDAKTIPPSTMARLQGIDTLIINALRFKPHLSHMNLEETLAVVAQANPRRALLIHESDGIGLHEATSRLLPQGVELAYDKEIIRVP